jgi:hypothetical protein
VIVIFHSHHVGCEGGDLVSLLGWGARRIRGDWSKLWGGMVVGVAAKCISVDLTRWQLVVHCKAAVAIAIYQLFEDPPTFDEVLCFGTSPARLPSLADRSRS